MRDFFADIDADFIDELHRTHRHAVIEERAVELAKADTWQGWVGAIYVGLFEMGFGFVLWLMALRHATNTAPISNLIFISPFASLVLLNLLIGETIHPATPIGLGLIVAALLIQIGTNLANDYFDFRKGADTAERLGPVRITQSGLVPPATVRTATRRVWASGRVRG